MAQLIDKSVLVAEIEKRKQRNHKKCTPEGSGAYYEDGFILDIINSLEVKDEQSAKEKQQWIDKACEWLEKNAHKFVCTKPYPYNFTTTKSSTLYCGYANKALIDNLKKAMEEL